MEILGQVRARFAFAILGYVIMPEHVHLLNTCMILAGASVGNSLIIRFFPRNRRDTRCLKVAQLALRFPEELSGLQRF